jgi:TolB-like protein/tetratricopeptide (TPR) repeat protein
MSKSMEERGPSQPADGDAHGSRLDSWKEVAVYLGRDVRTVQRWERREGLPIHRQQHDKLGSVYAFRHEVDAWRAARSQRLEESAGETASGPDALTSSEPEIRADASVLPDHTASRVDRRHRYRLAAAAIAVTIAVGAGGWLIFRQTGTTASNTRAEIRSIVVLPFENLSGDPTQEFFAAGLTEEVTARLAQLTTLRVVSRTSAMSLQGRRVPVPAIARDMDVDGVVEGSVRREGGRVRISIQLIDARTDTNVWARDFEREAAATWPLQIEVAQAVADAIRVQATPEERTRLAALPSVATGAREEYLLGRHLLWKFIEEDRVRAIEHFERAIRVDPQYAAPYAALAHAWWMRGVFGPLSLRDVATPAREAARAALALDDRNAEAHAALAYVQGMFDWEWNRALATAHRAVALEPNSVDARYVHALLLMATGRLDQAISEIDYAARLDPLSAQVHSTYGRVLYRARRFVEARVHLERALELEPRNIAIYARLANVHEQMGQYDDALRVLDQVEVPDPTETLLAGPRARVFARAGRTKEARQLLDRVSPQNPARAEVLALLDDHEAAFKSLFQALDQRDSLPLFIKSDPVFEGLHHDPRWADLLRRMNLGD